jgi:uncharacterized protein (TIGR00369 family)
MSETPSNSPATAPSPQPDLQTALARTLDHVGAPWVKALGLQVLEASTERTVLRLPVTPALVHGGGVVCGQALMAAADTAMVLALSAHLGAFQPMTTVQLQTSFLRPVPGDASEIKVVCTVLRRGKTLAFGEIEIFTPDDKLAVHATTTYALL